jgi:hypothetical protein
MHQTVAQLMRANLFHVFACSVLALALAGCVAPWSSPAVKNDIAKPATITADSPTNASSPTSPTDTGATASDMAVVLDKLQQVRAMDPSAEARLQDELRRVPASTWPLVAEQFRASLAYHQQLANRNQAEPREAQPVVDLRRAQRNDSATGMEAGPNPASQAAYVSVPAATDYRPSGAIGSLVDPHAAHSESAGALAQSTPYALPIPVADVTAIGLKAPAAFVVDGQPRPISGLADSANGASNEERTHPSADVVEQTLATAPGKAPSPRPLLKGEGSSGDWQQLVRKAAADLERRVSASPTTTAEVHQHVSLRVLRLLAGDTEKALEPIPHISPTEQDYWSRQLFALATYLDHHSQPDDKRRAAASVIHLDEAVSNLRELGSLSVRNLSFCKNVYGYGAIEPYKSDIFSPGQQVSLYVEVENYHSRSSDKGFVTALGSNYEIVDEKGTRVAEGSFPDVNDCCRTRRRDFHIQFGLNLPDKLKTGRYKLQLVVKDHQSEKIGNATVPFEIRGGKN